VIEQRKSLGVVLEHWEVSYFVFEQLVIWYYILVKLSLEVQGGHDYFRFVEGTCIIACDPSFSALLLSICCIKTLNSRQTLTQFNPPFLCFFSPSHMTQYDYDAWTYKQRLDNAKSPYIYIQQQQCKSLPPLTLISSTTIALSSIYVHTFNKPQFK